MHECRRRRLYAGTGRGDYLADSAQLLSTERAGPVYQQVAKSLQRKRADQTIGRYQLEFDILRRKAEARVVMGGAFLDGSESILRMQNAAPSRAERSLPSASAQESVDFPTEA